MSLPAAPKDISDHPKSGSVVDPTNQARKDADVDRKLRFYGVIEAFRQGRLPDNTQIDQTLKYVRDNSPIDQGALSPEGQKLIDDVRDIVETARIMVKEKNADELFQNFIWHTNSTDYSRAKVGSDALPVDKEKASNDGQEAVRHLRTLLNLVLTNSEVRKLMTDLSLLGRDILARGAMKAAEGIRPDQERLAQVDQPAPDDHFVDGKPVDAAMDKAGQAKDAYGQYSDAKEQAKGHAMDVARDPSSAQDKLNQAQSAADQSSAQGGALGQARDAAAAHAQDIQDRVDSVPDDAPDADERKQEAAKGGLKQKMAGLRDNLLDRVPQEHKDKANEHYSRGKEVLLDEYFPEDRRDQFIFRGKKVIIECQKHQDYQESMQWLIGFIEEYGGHGKTVAGTARDAHGNLQEDPALQTALSEIRTLLERFANGRSMDVIFSAVNQLFTDANNDAELRQWFSSVDAFVRAVLLEPGYVLEDRCNEEGNRLIDSGRQFYDGRYKGHFDNLFESTGSWFAAMGDDPINKRFGDDWARLTKDLLFDSEGSLKFKPELWTDVRKVILPTLIDQIGYVPIPRIEYTDDQIDLVVENLTLQGRNLFPNIVSLEAHNFMKFSPYNAISDESHHNFTFTFGQMQADMRDVMFYFRKKSGFPKLQDSGIADILLGGSGLSATVHLANSGRDRSSVFKVKDVIVKVDTLKFSIRDSKHDALYKVLRPLATGLVKKQIQKAIHDAIVTGLEYVDGQLVGVRDRMAEAKTNPEQNRAQALQELFQKKKDDVQSTKSSAKDSRFSVVAKRDSVILPEQGHPAGWVNRQAELQGAAQTGQEWRSPAFNIVPGSYAAGSSNTNTGTGASRTTGGMGPGAGGAGAAGPTTASGAPPVPTSGAGTTTRRV